MFTQKIFMSLFVIVILNTTFLNAEKVEVISKSLNTTKAKLYHDTVVSTPNQGRLTYLYAVIWANGYCKLDPQKPCHKVKLPESFTIHGLWAIDTTRPKPPPSTQPFDLTLIADLKEKMQDLWPSTQDYYFDEEKKKLTVPEKNNKVFWSHEWKDHGRKDPLFKNRFHDYYKHALDVFVMLDITHIIELSGKPNTPPLLRQALAAHNVRTPYLLCDKEESNTFLSELHFCMDGTATVFVDCPPRPPSGTRECDETKSFLY